MKTTWIWQWLGLTTSLPCFEQEVELDGPPLRSCHGFNLNYPLIHWSYDEGIVNFGKCCLIFSSATPLWDQSSNTLPIKGCSRSRNYPSSSSVNTGERYFFHFLTSWPYFLKAFFICLDYLWLFRFSGRLLPSDTLENY